MSYMTVKEELKKSGHEIGNIECVACGFYGPEPHWLMVEKTKSNDTRAVLKKCRGLVHRTLDKDNDMFIYIGCDSCNQWRTIDAHIIYERAEKKRHIKGDANCPRCVRVYDALRGEKQPPFFRSAKPQPHAARTSIDWPAACTGGLVHSYKSYCGDDYEEIDYFCDGGCEISITGDQ